MGSIRPPKTVFNETDLAQLEWVYYEVRAALEVQRGHIEDETKANIRHRLFMLACNGMNDRDDLRSDLLSSFMR